MFKRENRLVPGVRFGKSYLLTSSQFVLKERRNGLSVNRFGIVVSKKIDKRAVIRNKIKRIFREALSELNKNLVPGHDILLIAKKEVLAKTKEENTLAIKSALGNSGIFKK